MKRLLTCAAASGSLLAAAFALSAQAPAGDSVLQAMHDEIERARKLTLSNLEAPYFIQYVLDENDSFNVTASLGGLMTRRRDRFREPSIEVRVGDYKFDNTNYVATGFGGSRYDLERFPLENAYPVLRRYLWLETDTAYKAAVESISRKRAAIRNVNQTDALADFAHAQPVRYLHDLPKLNIDEETWAGRARSLSAVFAQYPELKDSRVELESSAGGFYLSNSEGSEVRSPETVTVLKMRAAAQSQDGMTLRDAAIFQSLDPSRMPTDAELTRSANTLAQNVVALAQAPKGEDYSGPVLFEGTAGAQVFAEVLGENLALTRRPITQGGRGGGFPASELEGRIGARVLPETFDVVDDPTQKEWRGRPLFGSYDVDREGVEAKPLKLIEKGVLKSYLLTRQPVRGYETSNGRARLPGSFGASNAVISNLFISSSDAISRADLKKKLIELCQARGKAYGILVRKMDFPSTASIDEARRQMAAAQGGAHPVSAPILVYKVYADGREELVRGMRFRSFNARSLKDILAAGTDASAFEYMNNSAPFALIGGASFTAETCVIAPSILIDDLELHPVEEEQPKLPVVTAPDLQK